MSGWIKLHRALRKNPYWTPDRGFYWVDLLLRANHKDAKILFNDQLLEIKRGSFVTSQLKLAGQWKCNIKTVRRILRDYSADNMITLERDNVKTTITIVNYDKYQLMDSDDGTTENEVDRTTEGTTIGTTIGTTGGTQTRMNKKKHKKDHTPSLEGGMGETSAPTVPDTSPAKKLLQITEHISMTRTQAEGLVKLFGKPACEYYKDVCEDHLKNSKHKYKDFAAFMRNWMRRDQSEQKGFFARNGFKPHVAANSFEKNLSYMQRKEREENGQKDSTQMFDDAFNSEKELDTQ